MVPGPSPQPTDSLAASTPTCLHGSGRPDAGPRHRPQMGRFQPIPPVAHCAEGQAGVGSATNLGKNPMCGPRRQGQARSLSYADWPHQPQPPRHSRNTQAETTTILGVCPSRANRAVSCSKHNLPPIKQIIWGQGATEEQLCTAGCKHVFPRPSLCSPAECQISGCFLTAECSGRVTESHGGLGHTHAVTHTEPRWADQTRGPLHAADHRRASHNRCPRDPQTRHKRGQQ